MMDLVVGSNHPRLLAWLQQHVETGAEFTEATTRVVALVDSQSGEPVAAVAFDCWTPTHVEATIASDGSKRWATRRFINAIYDYAFNHCGKHRINMVTSLDNDDANRMHEMAGHVCEGRLRDWFDIGHDALIWAYTRTDWETGKWQRSGARAVNTTSDAVEHA